MKLKRLAACLLAVVMAVGSAAVPFVGVTAYAAEGEEIVAYNEFVQEQVKKYGIFDEGLGYIENPENRGVAGFYYADLTGDGVFELVLTRVLDGNDQNNTTRIYTYKDGKIKETWSNGEYGSFRFAVCRDTNGKFFVYDSETRHFVTLYIWKNGEFISTSITDEEYETIVYPAAVEGGLVAEGDMIFQIQADKLGLDTTNIERSYEFFIESLGYSGNSSEIGKVKKALEKLQTLAEEISGYTYPEAAEVDDAALVKAIADAVAKEVDGEISGIYKLADGIYYVVIIVGDAEKGALVCGSKTNGEITWNVTEIHEERVSQDELDDILQEMLSKSNVELDYSKLSGVETEDVVTYIQGQIDNMNGIAPNDAAKKELTAYIESAISSSCGVAVKGKDNRLTLKSKDVAALAEEALAAKQQYEALLKENDIELNKQLTIMVRILWQNMDSGKPCQITLDKKLLDALSGCNIQILLSDGQHYIQLSESNLQKLIDKYGEVQIQMAKDGEAVYTIKFCDKSGNEIEKLVVPVTFGLPAISELSTVMASYGSTNANWGGQFDPNTMSLAFDVSFSGRYEIVENKLDIADIKDLNEESQRAISFMVSKGYMSLVDELFHPEAPLTRYEFAQALVGMFFALDPALTTNFADVPADSEYYSYVASGEAKEIIQGFSATEFGGDRNMTVEQMLAFAARTLIDSKGYAEPADADSYLTSFSDGEEVSDWAKAQVALAIREGLIDRGGELNPADEVTREQAAVILYRLFLLLYEVPKVELELPPTTGVSGGVIAAAVGGVVVVGGVAAAFMKKKKK